MKKKGDVGRTEVSDMRGIGPSSSTRSAQCLRGCGISTCYVTNVIGISAQLHIVNRSKFSPTSMASEEAKMCRRIFYVLYPMCVDIIIHTSIILYFPHEISTRGNRQDCAPSACSVSAKRVPGNFLLSIMQ